MDSKIKVGAVSYLNTTPLLYGIQHSPVMNDIELSVDYPAKLAEKLQSGEIDVALLPVAAIPTIPGAHVVANYGIAATGNVASVAIFSHVPIEEIESVYLDYQSRTSVRLAQVLLKDYWKKDVLFIKADERYIEDIKDNKAGVIIGDRALKLMNEYEYVYDLAEAWIDYTGLPFVFAAWVANKELPQQFINDFNAANALGVANIDKIAAETFFPYFDLEQYYKVHIQYELDAEKLKGMNKFLELIKTV